MDASCSRRSRRDELWMLLESVALGTRNDGCFSNPPSFRKHASPAAWLKKQMLLSFMPFALSVQRIVCVVAKMVAW